MNRAARRVQDRARTKLPLGPPHAPFALVPRDKWPAEVLPPFGMVRMLNNGHFVVMDCVRPPDRLLMVQRHNGADGITWDDLQWLKAAVGFGDREAVEVFPRDCDVVNVANMRHLWVLPAGSVLSFGLDKARALRGPTPG